MITKGIVEEIINIYQAKVRLPVYDGFADTKNATPSNELTIASICNIPNIYNTIAVGDIVYVAFEDNDLGNPVILGQLYKEEMNTLADIKLNSANINQLTVNKNASLPQNTSIGSISSKEIAALSGIKDNIQNQIDINLPAINFAESERQKSETDGAVTHNLDAPVVFAESERQKSKNLFDYTKFQQVGRANYYLEVNVGSSIGVYAPVGNSNGIHCWIEQYDENKTLLKSSNYWRDKFILQLEPTTKYLRFDTVSDYAQFMICYANSVDEIGNYQPYNGAIVHEKENPYPLLEYHELLLSANQTVNYETSTNLSFDTVPTNSTYISVNSDKNSFTILKPCKIKITGLILFNQSTNTNVDLHIMKNTRESVHCFALKFDDNKGMLFNIAPRIMDMATNDTFSLRLISGGSGATTSMKYFYTRVLVEVLKQW